MSERFKTLSAVFLLLIREKDNHEEILFQKRKNTGYCDGFYDLSSSGHVEANESMKHAMFHEAKEELGIDGFWDTYLNNKTKKYICFIKQLLNNNLFASNKEREKI